MDSVYKVGFIGCGGIGRAHARAYQLLGCTQLVAGADINLERAQAFVAELGVSRAYHNFSAMLAQEELDLISVCTWPRGHSEAVIAAAGSGVKGILCEKPMAINLDEADRMIEACDRQSVRLAIGHQHRYDPQSIKARTLITEGAIGPPQLFWGHCSLDLMNNGTHVIDLINFFNGDQPVARLIGQIDRRRKQHGRANHPDMAVEDMAVAEIYYQNGLRALVELGEFAPPAYQFHLLGSEGIIEVNRPGGPALQVLTVNQAGWVTPELQSVNPYAEEIRALIQAIETNQEPFSSGRKGRAALEIIMAIFESVQCRGMVEFPVTVRDFPLERMIQKGII